jgi:CRP-like cAMP-binding protein
VNVKDFLDTIRLTSLFSSFEHEELIDIFKKDKYRIIEYKKNSIIHFQNEKCRTLDIILIGCVDIQKIEQNGNVLTVCTIKTGDVMGANLIFAHNNDYPMTVLSKTDTLILHIKKELILDLCQRNKSFLIEFLHLVSDKTLVLTHKLKSVTMKTIRQRLIEFLAYEYYLQKSPIIKLEMSKKELAERFGTQRPSLSRELSKMKRDGLIEYDSRSITINNPDVLLQTSEQ